ncbi:MAG: hypothetical protein AAFZ65_18360, partial [Planctomycetota bacterium]
MIATDDLRSQTEAALAEARRRLEAFAQLDPTTDGRSRVATFDGITSPLKDVIGWLSLFESTHPDEAVRRE